MGVPHDWFLLTAFPFKNTTEKLKQMCPDQKLQAFLLIIQSKGNSLFIYLCLSKCKLAQTYSQKIEICIFLHFILFLFLLE